MPDRGLPICRILAVRGPGGVRPGTELTGPSDQVPAHSKTVAFCTEPLRSADSLRTFGLYEWPDAEGGICLWRNVWLCGNKKRRMREFRIMPIFKASGKLIYYAHVPKCGGSAVSWYLSERFGAIAFNDRNHTRHDPKMVWTKTSPQHADVASISRLFPDGFFDATFTIVRHPVARLLSAFYFQLEVEKTISERVEFSDWLEDMTEARLENPFLYDNHVRPMAEIVPQGAKVFHMEHGLDALVPWFDGLTGNKSAPRALPKINERGKYSAPKTAKIQPSNSDLDYIQKNYAEDFKRFGYSVDSKMPDASAPKLSAEIIAERDAALQRFSSPTGRVTRKIGRWIRS